MMSLKKFALESIKLILALVAVASSTLAYAEPTVFTVKVSTELNIPVAGIKLLGTHGFSSLAGSVTGTDGKFSFDLRDLDRRGSSAPLSIYLVQEGYRFEPAHLDVNFQNCPKRVCNVKAIADKNRESAVIAVNFVNSTGKGIADLPVMISDTNSPGILKTDGYGTAYFSVGKKTDTCIDNDALVSNDTNKLMLVSPPGMQCNLANVTSAVCSNKLINQVSTSISCTPLNLNSTKVGYTVRVRTRKDLALVGATLKVIPTDPNINSFNVTSNSYGEAFIPFSQIGNSSNFKVIPFGAYKFFPAELEVSALSCPGKVCHLQGLSSSLGQDIATIKIKASDNLPKSGVRVVLADSVSGQKSLENYSDKNGDTFFPVTRKAECNSSSLNSFSAHFNGCSFNHTSATPFKFCHQSSSNITLNADCINSQSESKITGAVFDPFGAPLPNVGILINNQLAVKTRADGSYTVSVPENSDSEISAWLDPYIFDPYKKKITAISSDKQINFTALTALGGMPEEVDQSICAISDQYTVSGTVFDRAGRGVANVVILNNHEPVATTNAEGQYSFVSSAYLDLWVTAEYEEELFDPAGVAIPSIACDRPQTNFQITGIPSFLRAGTVYDQDNNTISDFEISVVVDGRKSSKIVTDSAGYYRVSVLEGSSFAIQPIDPRYECTPELLSGTAEEDYLIGDINCVKDNCITDPKKLEPGVCGCGVADDDIDSDGTPDCLEQCPNDSAKLEPGICGCGVSDVDTDGDATIDCQEFCDNDPNKTDYGVCGCGVSDVDTDGDGFEDCRDECSLDSKKRYPLVCGCGNLETDSDKDGTPDCVDSCSADSNKSIPGVCGCGNSEFDKDNDKTPDCADLCKEDPNKIEPGICGCGKSDADSDNDGTLDCFESCPNDSLKTLPGICGCGISDIDTDKDGTADCKDLCPKDSTKLKEGICGCGISDRDSDNDGVVDCFDICQGADKDTDKDGLVNCIDFCPTDSNKAKPGQCGCGQLDTDTDGDGKANCIDECPNDKDKLLPGICGCGVSDQDTDGDKKPNCQELCPADPLKLEPGICGCNVADTDRDSDGKIDCQEECPDDPTKTKLGICGCGIPDTDTDKDSIADCKDSCPTDGTKTQAGICGCGIPDTDTDKDGTADCNDLCSNDASKTQPGQCGCGNADTDSDGDGTANCLDLCPESAIKSAPGICGCGVSDTDTDKDGTPDCQDTCPTDKSKITSAGVCGCGNPDVDTDYDGLLDCNDSCSKDALKTAPGLCGCGVKDTNTDGDALPDCKDQCPTNPSKIVPGVCGCNFSDSDTNNNGIIDCKELLLTVQPACIAEADKAEEKVTLCHKDGNHKHTILVAMSEVNQHLAHGDKTGKCTGDLENTSRSAQVLASVKSSTNNKIKICHIPPGNPENKRTISIASSAWKAHKDHGDSKGECDVDNDDEHNDDEDDRDDNNNGSPDDDDSGHNDDDEEDDEINDDGDDWDRCEKVKICHVPPGNPNAAHTLQISRNALNAHLAHGDIEGECSDDRTEAFINWKVTNRNAASYTGHVTILEASADQIVQLQIGQKTEKIISTKLLPGTNTAKLIVNGIEHSSAVHSLINCAPEPDIASITPQCIDTVDYDSQDLNWKIKNISQKSISAVVKIANSIPEQLKNIDLAPGEEVDYSSLQIEGSNTAMLYVDGVEGASALHELQECEHPNLVIGGSIKGVNGKELSANLQRMLLKFPVVIKVRDGSSRTTTIPLDETFSWRFKVQSGTNIKVWMEGVGWQITSAPRVFRSNDIEFATNGMHFAVRRGGLNLPSAESRLIKR